MRNEQQQRKQRELEAAAKVGLRRLDSKGSIELRDLLHARGGVRREKYRRAEGDGELNGRDEGEGDPAGGREGEGVDRHIGLSLLSSQLVFPGRRESC